jgi:hypothetical protein
VRSISHLGTEDAIAVVEDEIARVRPSVPDTLQSSDAHIRALAAGLNPFTIEAVEQDFQRLAARSIPPELVILRELMHHLQVKLIRLV